MFRMLLLASLTDVTFFMSVPLGGRAPSAICVVLFSIFFFGSKHVRAQTVPYGTTISQWDSFKALSAAYYA